MFSQVRMQSIEGGAVDLFWRAMNTELAEAVRQCTHSVPDKGNTTLWMSEPINGTEGEQSKEEFGFLSLSYGGSQPIQVGLLKKLKPRTQEGVIAVWGVTGEHVRLHLSAEWFRAVLLTSFGFKK